MGELLLEDAGLLGDEPVPQQEPDEVPGLKSLHDLMETQRLSWGSKSPEVSTSEEETLKEGGIPNQSVFRQICELLENSDDYITFEDLVPAGTYRELAAKIFHVCIQYGRLQLIDLQQDEPFGTIYIQRGKTFTDADI
ncbi:uncharacterized protein [Amphiura filiformis]|uniref:uncharacterized protein isoform X1 n=1 Tax=Amphiura filiformis TaxID=82378 RepID=UPI003B21BABE